MPPRPYWSDLVTTDFAAPDVASWIAVLPVAAIEQHGPHLPLGTDTLIAEAHVAATVARLPAGLPVVFLPTRDVAWSIEHDAAPGTLTLDHRTAVREWLAIAEGVAAAGLKKLVIVSSHGGNSPLVDIVTRELRVRRNLLAVATSWSRFGRPDGLIGDDERRHGIHAGDIETSMILAIRPDLVRTAALADFPSEQAAFERDFTRLRAYGPHAFGWRVEDLHPAGAVGDARTATAEKGRALIDHAVTGFLELLADVHRFDPARLSPSGRPLDAP